MTFGTALLALVLAVVVSYVAASPTFGWTGGCSGSSFAEAIRASAKHDALCTVPLLCRQPLP